ncbi:ADAM metallopeptidase with thrombospondin type 1 motif B [Anticarsia gemmatalis]|uniref:ADAM metallopeptidase with thrombospondin type 1 motif B n=1 Tax=Anticarsia gemmatalis TaxID=129554 RepID=UPI003F76335B
MRVTNFRVLRNMDVRCSLFKLLLFQMLVTWCGAKHVTINLSQETDDNLRDDVHDSVRNLIHTGIYSHKHMDPSMVQVTHPVKVSYDGELVSHELEHAHEHGHARARRDLRHTEHLQPHTLHYNLTVDGRDLRLDLRPSVTFITPGLVVETHHASGRTRDKPLPDATACHYTGNVRGQPASKIALSACDGLAGLLRTEHGEYWIEPSKQQPTDSSAPRPHVIFKRSAVDKVKARAKREIDSRGNLNTQTNKNNHLNTQANRYNRVNTQTNRTDQRRDRPYNNRQRMNARRHREYKEARDKRRREYLEQRRRRMQQLRQNPTEYRRHQAVLRMEERRLHSNSRSNSIENSSASNSSSLETRRRNRNRASLTDEQRLRRVRNRRRRKRSKNCATKQPKYLWRKQNLEWIQAHRRMHKNQHRSPRHHNYSHHHDEGAKRSTRSVSKPRYVEVLLVADKSMSEFHDNLQTYLLTIMNMVSLLYMDPSIGNYIKVVVVKIILVEEIDRNSQLDVTTNADVTLASFCRWQQQLNPEDDTHPHHHDVAILVTRQDICSQYDTICSTLGVAHVAGMCKPDRSCSINEDNGIMLAHTITHELGHNFGLYHDTEEIGCNRSEGSTLHIMTPIFESEAVLVAWSRCSKRDVTNFLDAGLGECLSDQPSQEEYTYPEVPAGVTFDAESQCHMQFGAESVVCSDPDELCNALWCLVNNKCNTLLRPPADGTTCGPDMWCLNKTCVPRTPSPSPRNGGWGPWSEWSECSRSCGAGVSTQSRECNNPKPHNNGVYCIGDRSRHKVCNNVPCPINEPSFRETQCSKYNNMTFRNETIREWIPYFDPDRPCKLQCVARDGSDIEMLGGFVADGTPCRQTIGARDMCIAGVCYKVGCDWIIGSEMEEDQCGVCGGNGTACKTVQGIYDKGTTKQSGFSEVAVIPAGSRNVKIKEKVSPGNYISIGSAKSNKIYLNGARNAPLTEYFVAGAQAIYERDRDWEKVRIPGPLVEDIKVYQRIYRGHRNPGVTYQYVVDRQRGRKPYRYRLTEWSACSVTCGVGYMRRKHECVDEHNRVVKENRCYHIEPPRHEALMQRCRQPTCPVHTLSTHWWVGPWNPCAKSCHMPGEDATKERNVYCVDKITNKVIDDSECDELSKPINKIICTEVPAC